MTRPRHNFEQALENLEKLKKISFGSSNDVYLDLDNPAYLKIHRDARPILEMKEALKNVEEYLYTMSFSSKNQADKVLRESDFLIAGVQNVFSFLENHESNLYYSLAEEYSQVNKAYSKVLTNLHQKTFVYSKEEEQKEFDGLEEPEHFLNNLVEVKKDRSYELFYMLDEENKRFYSDTLAQIICKQNKLHETVHEGDPLTKTLLWNSNEIKNTASFLIFNNDMSLRLFYQHALSQLDIEAVLKVHNAVMALFFSRYEANVVYTNPKKNNLLYFNDFLLFLRETWQVLNNRAYTTSQEQKQAELLALALSVGIFENRLVFEEVAHYLYFHIHTKLCLDEEKKPLSSGQYITDTYDELHRLFAQYPNGPVFKAIDRILESESRVFDPMILGILPSLEGTLKRGEQTIDIIRSPSPVSQSSILYANCNEEFLGFLHGKAGRGEISLILNIQNRISRKEKARSRLLEEVIEQKEDTSFAYIVSFPEPEELLNNIETIHGDIETFATFFSVLKEEFHKPLTTSSFFLSKGLKEAIYSFLEDSLHVLKDVFFAKKKILFKNDKFLLLHLISYLLVFKCIEIINPSTLMVISKDGLDYASVFVAGFAFFSRDNPWDEHSLKLLLTKILAPTLVARDRLIFASHIEIFSKFLNCLKKNRHNLSTIKAFFNHDIESWKFVGYLNEFIEASYKHNL
ncbi:calcium-binding protein [Candidatus Chlamydia sanziniae]|uniref:Calcium binding EF-hand protein n=1 Tax=Candidatus Chlamydia sanziniae TaxID=1806891 RepID=A0A1A9HXF5_9CHLA|nr:calcium-binding protein [Candidatus Chlamydia sanziniae]ANH78783.1 hypothetical protein Cs308_0613 [Candidatus Chlamydia sanziniae]